MPSEIFASYLISLTLAALAFKPGGDERHDGGRLSKWIGAACLLYSIYPRLIHLNATSHGMMLFEELSAMIYMEQMHTGKPTYTGATQMTFFVAMEVWRFVFGLSALAARALSGVFGAGALVFLFLALRRLTSSGTAWLATGFLSMSLYAAFFSRLAIEPAWSLFFFSFGLYLYTRLREGRRGYFLLGLTVALGVFSYPGYTLWLLCAAPFLAYSVRRDWKSLLKPGLWTAGGFALFTLPALIFHAFTQSHAPLFRGGGVWMAESNTYLESLAIHLLDLFVSADSYYLIFLNETFAELTLLGFFGVGVWRLVAIEKRGWAKVLLGSALLLPFFSAAATNHPGMRRAILFLPVYYIFAGAGLDLLLAKYARTPWVWRAPFYALTAAALALPALSQTRNLEQAANARPFDRYSEIIQHPEFLKWLKAGPVRIVMNQPHEFQAGYLSAYVFLAKRYYGFEPDFNLLQPPGNEILSLLSAGKEELWIFEDLKLAQSWIQSGKACLKDTVKLETPHSPFYSTRIKAGACE